MPEDTSNTKALQKSVENLEDFSKELKNLLKDFRRNSVVNRETKNHQKKLEKLIDTTNKIVKKSATEQEIKGFDDLVSQTELSYKILKENHKNDKRFQTEFVKTFGNVKEAGSLQAEVMKKISLTIADIGKSVSIINRQAVQDVQDTALTYLTGPFGRMFKESVDTSGIKEIIAKRKEAKMQKQQEIESQFQSSESGIMGKFHAGVANVPMEGSYLLNKGERVVAPKDNGMLTKFLEDHSGAGTSTSMTPSKPTPVYNTASGSGFFDDLIENDDMLSVDEAGRTKSQHKELVGKFDLMTAITSSLPLGYYQYQILANEVMMKRFVRHPIAFTVDTLIKLVGGTFRAFGKLTGFFFGKKKAKTNEELMVFALEDIRSLLDKGYIEEDKRLGIFRKMLLSKDTPKKMQQGLITETARSAKERASAIEMQMLDMARITSVNTGAIANKLLDPEEQAEWVEVLRDTKRISSMQLEKLEDIEKASGRGGKGLLGFLAGKGKILGGILIGLLASSFKAAGPLLLTAGRSLIGLLITGISAAASSGLLAAGATIIAAIGTALAVGGLIGTYIVNPILEAIDEVFGTGILEAIGGFVVRMVAWMEENVPFFKTLTGGEATETLKREEENKKMQAKYEADMAAINARQSGGRVGGVSPNVPVSTQPKLNIYPGQSAVDEDRLAKKIGMEMANQRKDTNNQPVITQKPAVEEYGTYMATQGH